MQNLIMPVLLAILTMPLVLAGGEYVNVDASGLALQGYDPVAYFLVGRPLKGNPMIPAEHQGARYHFSSEENRQKFLESPDQYVPRFGGFCAYAVSKGYTAPIDVDAFEIHEGHLLLQNSPRVLKLFDKNKEENFRKAEANWPRLVEKNSKRN